MSVRNWNFYSNNSIISSKKRIGELVSLWVAIGLLWLSFFAMLTEQFPEFEMDRGVLVFWLLSMGVCHSVKKQMPKTRRWVCLAVDAGIPFAYILINITKIATGINSVAQLYMTRWNLYHGNTISLIIPPAQGSYIMEGCTCIIMLVWLGLWSAACLFKHLQWLTLFPLLAAFLGMMVGTSPMEIRSWGCFLAAVFLLLMPKGMAVGKKAGIVAAVTWGVLFFGSFFQTDSTEWFDLKIELQTELQDWISSITFPDFGINGPNMVEPEFVIEDEKLDNSKPRYNGKVILTIEGKKPSYPFYLKGFYGTEYVNGIWKQDNTVFEDACIGSGRDFQNTAQRVAGMPYVMMNHVAEGMAQDYIFRYGHSLTNRAYFPYNLVAESLGNEIFYEGDYLIGKSVFSKELTVQISSRSVAEFYDPAEIGRKTDNFRFGQWYRQVALAYTQNRESIPCIVDAARQIRPTLHDTSNPINIAKDVRAYLASQMSYSLELDELPQGTDPVEYALTIGHEGYCMHFATAGTLILRELGIPARYASGYIVVPYDFAWSATTKQYTASVRDYAAHAWVEVYVENVGWVPVEMTPGYGSDIVIYPTEMHPDDWENLGNYQPETETETESETESSIGPDDPFTEDTQNHPTEDTQETEEPTETEGDSENVSEGDSQEDTQGQLPEEPPVDDKHTGLVDWKEVANALLPVIIPVGILLLLAGFGRIYLLHQEKKLKQAMERHYTRPAVKQMNRRIYHSLRMHSFVKLHSDGDYEKALIQAYPQLAAEDWKKYLSIVKKTIYSEETISVEEMEHCYKCYMAVKRK